MMDEIKVDIVQVYKEVNKDVKALEGKETIEVLQVSHKYILV
jgi:hypothetical protein